MHLGGIGVKVYLGVGETDMRKSVDGLSILVSEYLKKDPLSGNMFVFCNGRRTILKILYWDRNGFCLWYKRLEKDKFRWPETRIEVEEISIRELEWLIEGLEIHQPKAHKRLDYEGVY
jgi:transposase